MADALKGWTCAACVSVHRSAPRRCGCAAKVLATARNGRKCGLCGVHKRELAYSGVVRVFGPPKDSKQPYGPATWMSEVVDADAQAAAEQRFKEGQREIDERRILFGYIAVAEAAGLAVAEVLARCPRKARP